MGFLSKLITGASTLLGGPFGGAIATIGGGLFDNFMANRTRKKDEARLRANSGYDLVKLREQATAAGFNPLTVLQATGAAGYDGRGAVMATPFQPFGRDALTGLGADIREREVADRNFALESRRLDLMEGELRSLGVAASSGGGSPFDRGPVESLYGTLPSVGASLPFRDLGMRNGVESVRVASMSGDVFLDPRAAARLGIAGGEWLTAEDMTTLLGDLVGELSNSTAAPFAGGPFVRAPAPLGTDTRPLRRPFVGFGKPTGMGVSW